ncbi:hypothetical protein Tco_1129971, partial [Tanacetum coccineum]
KAKKSVRLMMEKLIGMEFELMLAKVNVARLMLLLLGYYCWDVKGTIYVSCIQQFWSSAVAKTVNGEVQLHALVDGKRIVITETSVRRTLQLADDEGIDYFSNSTIFENLALMGPKTTAWNEFSSTIASAIICLATNQKFNFSKLIFDGMVRNLDNLSVDEAVHKERGDRLVRAATTASSLEAEQDSGNITKTRSNATLNETRSPGTSSGSGPRCQETMGDTIAQTRFENVSTQSYDPLLARVLPVKRATTTVEEITLAQVLESLKTTKPKQKGVVIQEPGESTTTISLQQLQGKSQSQDKGKGILVEEPVKPVKKKDQIRLDEEAALRLQVEFDEEERLAREIDADYQLAKRLQAEEQEQFTIEEKATLFKELLEQRRKHFAAKRSEEQRNKPLTKAQQRKIMCNYLKNMEGYKFKYLKSKGLDIIQEMFDRAFKRVNTFEDFRTELVEGKEKRAGGRIVGIKSLLNVVSITAALIDVNAAQSKLVLLENFNENYSKCLRLLYKVNAAEGVNAASEEVSTVELVSTAYMICMRYFGVKTSTSASGSQPSGNTKKDKTQQTPSST